MPADPQTNNPSVYFREWYEQNGDELNKRRRNRYQTDPEYRERVLAQNRDARRKKRQEALEERKKKYGAKKLRLTNNWKTVNVETPDGIVKMFSISAAAKLVGCSVQALRLWERKGIIPPATARYSKGDRLYSMEQIDLLKEVLEKQLRLEDSKVRPRPLQSIRRKVKLSTGEVKEMDLFRIGVMATRVGRTVVTLEQLEQRGAMPATPFRISEVGYRMYSAAMMDAVKSAFDRRVGEVRGEEEWKKFHDEVLADWKAQGVVGAKMLPAEDKKKPAQKAKK